MSYLKTFRDTLAGKDFLVLDTETTGLEDGEIVQIAIIDNAGKTLMNSLVKPKHPIPSDATRIHGITDDMCETAPTWLELVPEIKTILDGKLLVVYNAVYDRKMMHRTAERWDLPKIEWKEISTWLCAMEAYAEFYGDYNHYRGNYRWQKLVVAAQNCGVTVENAHDALGDCLMALGVVKHMLKVESEADNG